MSQTLLNREPPDFDAEIPYGDDLLQFGHLRLPESAGPHPAILAIHGGFWRNQYSLDHLGHLCAAFTELGFVTWSIEYRRIGDEGGAWPGTFQDAAAGAAFLFSQLEAWEIDPERVLALGHSAGGHLASWLGCMENVPEPSEIRAEPLPWRGVVSLAGVLDLEEAWRKQLSGDVVADLLGGTPAEVPERYRAASPMALVPSDVPHLVVHGEQDTIVPVSVGRAWHEEAQCRGADSTLLLLPEADHFDLIDPESDVWPELAEAVTELSER